MVDSTAVAHCAQVCPLSSLLSGGDARHKQQSCWVTAADAERFTCLMKISRRRDWPHGLYFRLNLSNRWKMFLSACMSSVSTFRSYLQRRDGVKLQFVL